MGVSEHTNIGPRMPVEGDSWPTTGVFHPMSLEAMTRNALLTVVVAALLQTPMAEAKEYYSSPPQLGGFSVEDKCYASKEKVEKGVALNPTVLEYVLSRPQSFVHSHFAAYSAYIQTGGGRLSSNPVVGELFQKDFAHVASAQSAFVMDHAESTTIGSVASLDNAGEIMARATARQTVDAARQAFERKGCAVYKWGWRWDKTSEGWKASSVDGVAWTTIYAYPSKSEVHVHLYSPKGFSRNTGKPVAVYDLSGVEGAFDAGAEVAWNTVVENVQAGPAALDLEFDLAVGYIIGTRR